VEISPIQARTFEKNEAQGERKSSRISRVRPFVAKPSQAAIVELEPLPIHKLKKDTCSVVIGTGSTKQKHS